jgi:endonuclease YncB( thermonuclease family)
MLKAGLAWHYKQFDTSAEYANLEMQARNQKSGLWVDNHPIAPWTFRMRQVKGISR